MISVQLVLKFTGSVKLISFRVFEQRSETSGRQVKTGAPPHNQWPSADGIPRISCSQESSVWLRKVNIPETNCCLRRNRSSA